MMAVASGFLWYWPSREQQPDQLEWCELSSLRTMMVAMNLQSREQPLAMPCHQVRQRAAVSVTSPQELTSHSAPKVLLP